MKKLNKTEIIDIVFTVIFVLFLFVPLMHINKVTKSPIENRLLSEFKPLFNSDHSINYNFGQDFSNWFDDRFFMREKFINIYLNLKYNLPVYTYQFNECVLNKKTNYIFRSTYFFNTRKEHLKFHGRVSDEAIRNLKRIKKFCQKNNIKLYIVSPSGREEFVTEDSFPLLIRDANYLASKMKIEFIENKTGIKAINPYDQIYEYSLKSAEPMFFKADYHWTDIGAYVAYTVLMQEIKKDFKNVKITPLEDFDTYTSNLTRCCPIYGFFEGDYYQRLSLNNKQILDQQYTYLIPKNYNNVIEKHDVNYPKQTIKNYYQNKNNPKAPNLLMYGDSSSLNMLPSLISSFNITESIFSFGGDDAELTKFLGFEKCEKDLIEKKIDILVLCFVNFNRYRYMYSNGAKNGI